MAQTTVTKFYTTRKRNNAIVSEVKDATKINNVTHNVDKLSSKTKNLESTRVPETVPKVSETKNVEPSKVPETVPNVSKTKDKAARPKKTTKKQKSSKPARVNNSNQTTLKSFYSSSEKIPEQVVEHSKTQITEEAFGATNRNLEANIEVTNAENASCTVQSPKRQLSLPKDVSPSKKKAVHNGKILHTPSKVDISSVRKKLDMGFSTKNTDEAFRSEQCCLETNIEITKTQKQFCTLQSPKRQLPLPKDVTPSKKKAMQEEKDRDGKILYIPVTPSKDEMISSRKKLDMDSLTKNTTSSPGKKVITPQKSPKLGKLDNMIELSRSKLLLSPKLNELRKSLSEFKEKTMKLEEFQSNPYKVNCIAKASLSPDKPRKVILPQQPAFERYSHLVDTTYSSELVLPYKFKMLAEVFRSLDQVVSMLNNRKEKAVFNKIKEGVEKIVKRTFTEKDLAQIMTVLSDAYSVTLEKCSGITKTVNGPEYQYILTPILKKVQTGKKTKAAAFTHMTPELLSERMNQFNENLLQIVKKKHKDFLERLKITQLLDEDIKRWHPRFNLNSLPDIKPSVLPQLKDSKIHTAKDVLNRVKNTLRSRSQKVEQALQSVSDESRNKDVVIDLKSVQNKEPQQSKIELKGIDLNFLAKIRAKETAKCLGAMTETPDQKKVRAMQERLPTIIKIIWHYFVAERKVAVPIDTVIEKIQHSCNSLLTPDDIKAHLNLVIKQYPDWLTLIEIPKGVFVRIDKMRDINKMLQRPVNCNF